MRALRERARRPPRRRRGLELNTPRGRESREALTPEAIVTNGAGNYAALLQRFFQFRGFNTQLAPTNGAMGYGVPAAVAAQIAHPDRMVVAVRATAAS